MMSRSPSQTRYSADALEGVKLKGRYQVLQKVSHGGMAWVYRGVEDGNQRPLAIKVLFAHLSHDNTARERFRLEAQYQSRWQHPNIVRVLDYVEEGGLVGMVMDWIEGPSLQHLFDEKPRPFTYPGMVALMLPLVEAIGYAHAHQVVHRDLKPSNILMQQLSHGFLPKVADFGIAKSLAPNGPMLTATDNVMGTVQYMAPEQILSSKHIDHRVDIYSLGVILYQLVTGRLLFTARGMHQWAYLQRKVQPADPSEYAPDVPRSLEFVIKRCLEKDATKRYEDCAALRQALRATGLASLEDDTVFNVQESTKPLSVPTSLLNDTPEAGLPGVPGTSSWGGDGILEPMQTPPPQLSPPTKSLSNRLVAGGADGPTLASEVLPHLEVTREAQLHARTIEEEGVSEEIYERLRASPRYDELPSVDSSHSSMDSLSSASGAGLSSSTSLMTDESTWSLFLYIGLFLSILGGGVALFVYAMSSDPPPSRPLAPLVATCLEGAQRSCYGGPPGTQKLGVCKAGVQTCRGGSFGPCSKEIRPAPQELCNGRDDDCDGLVDEDFSAKGKACIIPIGACRFPGKQACRQDYLGLACEQLPPRRADKMRRIRMSLSPGNVDFFLYIQAYGKRGKVRRLPVRGESCIEIKARMRMKLQADGYESCSFPVLWRNQQLRLQLQKKSELLNAPNYCLKAQP